MWRIPLRQVRWNWRSWFTDYTYQSENRHGKAQKIGIEKYNEEQSKKVEILNKFLENYNPDNNKEVFFCTAVNLLPLDDLEDISNSIDDATSSMSLEEKYDYLKGQLFEYGDNHNIKIELRKGKYNEERISFE